MTRTVYLGLMRDAVEVKGAGYARQAVVLAQGADGEWRNVDTVVFPGPRPDGQRETVIVPEYAPVLATGIVKPWCNLNVAALFAAPEGGEWLALGFLDPRETLGAFDELVFAPGKIMGPRGPGLG